MPTITVDIKCKDGTCIADQKTVKDSDTVRFHAKGTSVAVSGLPSIFTDTSSFNLDKGKNEDRQITANAADGTYQFDVSCGDCSDTNERATVIVKN